MFGFVFAIVLVIVLVVGIWFFHRFHAKANREIALARTGFGGQKVLLDGGYLALPFLHKVAEVIMRVPASALMDDALPGAWQEGATNGADLTRALSHARGEAMPWGLVRESIADGVDSRWLEIRDGDAEILHRAYREAGRLVLERPPQAPGPGPAPPPVAPPGSPATNIEGHQVQDLADLVPELLEASAGYRLEFRVQVVLNDAPAEVRTKVDQLIDARLKPGADRSP